MLPASLLDGHARFRAGRLAAERERWHRLVQEGQRPEVMVVACCDSRVAPELIFDARPGELFVVRNVANLVPPWGPGGTHHGTSAALEFGVSVLGVRHVVVMGHARCGGIAAALRGAGSVDGGDHIAHWLSLIDGTIAACGCGSRDGAVDARRLERSSIVASIANLRSHPMLAQREAAGLVAFHGLWFDISDGALFAWDEANAIWRSATGFAATAAQAPCAISTSIPPER